MRFILFPLLTILLPLACFSQIELEHEYDPYVNYAGYISDGEPIFYRINKSNSNLEIFDISHTMIKAIPIDVTATYVNYISRYLFDLDDKIEFIVNYSYDHPTLSQVIMNEDGQQLFSVSKNYSFYPIVADDKAKLIVSGNSLADAQTTKVYNLPGSYPSSTSKPKDGEKGEQGEKGDKPAHQWDGTKLRIENPDGTWGTYVDLQGSKGEQGIQGNKGKQGEPGAMPDHQWNGTKLRIENPDGTWGTYVDLQGNEGEKGESGTCNCEDTGSITGTGDRIVKDAILSDPKPNPANIYSHVDYSLPASSNNTSLAIFNSSGILLKNISLKANTGSLQINTSDMSPGVYFYRLQSEQGVSNVKKLVVSK